MFTNSTPPPPPRSWAKSLLLIVLAVILLGAAPALAQQTGTLSNAEITDRGGDCLWFEWETTGAITSISVYIKPSNPTNLFTDDNLFATLDPGETAVQFTGLTLATAYFAGVSAAIGDTSITSTVGPVNTRPAATACPEFSPRKGIELKVAFLGSECLWLSWREPTLETGYTVAWLEAGNLNEPPTRDTDAEQPYLITGLTANTEYQVVNSPHTAASEQSITVTTASETTACPSRAEILLLLNPPQPPKKSSGSGSAAESDAAPTPRPPDNTCPDMLPAIVVSGYVTNASQCQVVDGAGVGRQDLVNRGIVSAVDIWSLVPNTGVEVCFRNMGAAVVFLDAAYSPRLLSTLEYVVRDGMTCTTITTTGTVVLLAS